MSTPPSFIPVRATEQLIDALNAAVEVDGGAHEQVTFLLQRLQELLGRPTRCALWLMEDLRREPAPRIVERVVVRPTFDDGRLDLLSAAQQALDESTPLSRVMVRQVLDCIRSPFTLVASQVGDRTWFDAVLVARHLGSIGYADCVTSMWAASDDRAIFLVVHRRDSDPEFTDKDVMMVSLMLRAVAPIIDREIFRRRDSNIREQLSPREREILLRLLAGESEKQIATSLHRSVHTVHTFVGQLYRRFGVSSRGELMATFVDQAVLEDLRQSTTA